MCMPKILHICGAFMKIKHHKLFEIYHCMKIKPHKNKNFANFLKEPGKIVNYSISGNKDRILSFFLYIFICV